MRCTEKQEIRMNEDGKKLCLAWKWKLQGEKDIVIIEKLKDLGLVMKKQTLSSIWRRPFYCGVNSTRLLDEPVKGNWEPMITKEEFWRVQDILKGNNSGYKVEKGNPARPLTLFIQCYQCGEKMTGYEVKAKNLHYYKCQKCKDATINTETRIKSKGKGAHDLFKELLKEYELKDNCVEPFIAQLNSTYKTLNSEKISENDYLKKQLDKQNEDLKNLTRKYVYEGLDKAIFEEFKKEHLQKIRELSEKLEKSDGKISNLEKYIDISLDLAKNISKYWGFDSLEIKQQIQETVFPGGLVIDIKNRAYLTKKVNSVFALSKELSKAPEDANEKRQPISQLPSSSVAGE